MNEIWYNLLIIQKDLEPAKQWCEELWGSRFEQVLDNRDGTWCVYWTGFIDDGQYQYNWKFKTKEQRNWFMLRWL